jgi:hypothetical protein
MFFSKLQKTHPQDFKLLVSRSTVAPGGSLPIYEYTGMCRAGGSTFLDFWYLGGSQKHQKLYLGGSHFVKFGIWVGCIFANLVFGWVAFTNLVFGWVTF